jgi:hypothetical protein
LPPVTKHVEGGRPLVVQYVAMQFVDRVHPADDAASTRPPGPVVVVPCTVITTSDSIWENGPHFTTTDIKTLLSLLTPTPHRCRPHWAPSSPSPAACSSRLPTPARSGTPWWPRPNPAGPRHYPQSHRTICSTCPPRPHPSRRRSTLLRTSHSRPWFAGAIVGGSPSLSGV